MRGRAHLIDALSHERVAEGKVERGAHGCIADLDEVEEARDAFGGLEGRVHARSCPRRDLVEDDELGAAEAVRAQKLDARLRAFRVRDDEPVERAASCRDGRVVLRGDGAEVSETAVEARSRERPPGAGRGAELGQHRVAWARLGERSLGLGELRKGGENTVASQDMAPQDWPQRKASPWRPPGSQRSLLRPPRT